MSTATSDPNSFFAERVPAEWFAGPPEVRVDRD